MRFWAKTRQGAKLFLGAPLQASLSWDKDAPADLLRAVFPAQAPWEELGEISLFQGERELFTGPVDEQNTKLSGDGLRVEIIARSREALLLDNEAPPGTIPSPGLGLLEERLLLPLGLSLGSGDREARLGELSIRKGESCWTALARFCQQALGTVPRVGESGLVDCGPGGVAEETQLSNILEATLSILPCRRIGSVWMQSFAGGYDTLLSGDLGTLRRRYVSAQSGTDPRRLIAESLQNSRKLSVTLAHCLWPVENRLFSGEIPGIGRAKRLSADKAVLRMDASGVRLRLEMLWPDDEKGGGAL